MLPGYVILAIFISLSLVATYSIGCMMERIMCGPKKAVPPRRGRR
jgi:hypothetical protein